MTIEKKYELTDETIEVNGKTLYRIKALKDFGRVKNEVLGGFVESESNLSHDGNCWIYDDAQVFDNAYIFDNAEVLENAKVYHNTKVRGKATVYGNAEISGNVQVSDNAKVFDKAQISGDVQIFDNAEISGDAEVSDKVKVYGNARVSVSAKISGNAEILNYASISGDAVVSGDVFIAGHTVIFGYALIQSNKDWIDITSGNLTLTAFKLKNGEIVSTKGRAYYTESDDWIYFPTEKAVISNKELDQIHRDLMRFAIEYLKS